MATAARGEREVDDTSSELSESVTTTGAGAGAAGEARLFLAARRSFLKYLCGNQPVRQAGLEVLFTILAASTQRESAWRPRTRRLRLTRPNV